MLVSRHNSLREKVHGRCRSNSMLHLSSSIAGKSCEGISILHDSSILEVALLNVREGRQTMTNQA